MKKQFKLSTETIRIIERETGLNIKEIESMSANELSEAIKRNKKKSWWSRLFTRKSYIPMSNDRSLLERAYFPPHVLEMLKVKEED